MRAGKQVIFLLITAVAGVAGAGAQDVADANAAVLQRLERIERALSNQGLLEMLQQVQAMEAEINRLRGEMEVQTHLLEQLKKRQRDLYTDIDRRMQRLENPVPATFEEPPAASEPPLQTLSPFEETETAGTQQFETPLTLELVGQEPAAGAIPDPAQGMAVSETPDNMVADTPAQGMTAPETSQEVMAAAPVAVDPELVEAAYRHAFNLLKQALYDRAIKAFREFLARYSSTEYADKAQFWLAEAYYVNSRFGQALVEYSTLVRRYPESRKLPQAKLKAAFCQHELGHVEAAGRELGEIVRLYPGTATASLAQDRLKQMAAATAIPADAPPAN